MSMVFSSNHDSSPDAARHRTYAFLQIMLLESRRDVMAWSLSRYRAFVIAAESANYMPAEFKWHSKDWV